MDNKLIAPAVIVALLIGGGGFYGGMKYAQARPTVQARPGNGAQGFRAGMGAGALGGQGRGAFPAGAAAGGFTSGEVVSKDATTLTLKLRDGGSKLVLYSTSTRIGKMSEGAITDLTPGTEVTVMGSANQDGSLTASQFQIRPAGQPDMGMGRGAR
jgi:hypothetical protein